MQSSFNVIKNSRVVKQGNREINTQISQSLKSATQVENHDVIDANLESYKNIAENILASAKTKSQDIISSAYIDSEALKTQAFESGMEQGYKEGFESAYDKAMDIATKETNIMKAKADSIIMSAKAQYKDYLIEKENHIKALIINIVENILKKEVKEPDALNEMIFYTLKAERNIKTYIIKVNNSHFSTIKEQVEIFKAKLAFQGDIFVIEDNLLDDGTAVIEKETGKSIVSIDYGLEKIIEIFQQEQI
jgi:flagellar assembly protein FliH